jgi:hypothetical protein
MQPFEYLCLLRLSLWSRATRLRFDLRCLCHYRVCKCIYGRRVKRIKVDRTSVYGGQSKWRLKVPHSVIYLRINCSVKFNLVVVCFVICHLRTLSCAFILLLLFLLSLIHSIHIDIHRQRHTHKLEDYREHVSHHTATPLKLDKWHKLPSRPRQYTGRVYDHHRLQRPIKGLPRLHQLVHASQPGSPSRLQANADLRSRKRTSLPSTNTSHRPVRTGLGTDTGRKL